MTAKQRRRGLDVAEMVAKIAGEEPDGFAKDTLYRAARAIRTHYGYKESEKEEVVLKKIAVGASTISDLIRETGFPQPDIWRITKSLVERGEILEQKMSYSGTGRPTFLYFLTDTPGFD